MGYNGEMTLVGRDEEHAELSGLLDVAPVVVLVGAAGVGKSALARAMEPALWVDLEGASTAADVRSRFAEALDAPLATWGRIAEALPSGPVVLDSAESAVDALTEVVAWLPRASLLVTTRARPPLDAPVMDVLPLSPDAGAQLLRGQLRSVRRGQDVSDEALEALSEALDGVPLALELAARRLRLYSPEEVARRGIEALRDPQRPPRQDLASEIKASVGVLDAEVQEVLARAARLPGAFDAALLTVACGAPADDAMLVLLDASLVQPVGGEPPRFRILAPVREVVRGIADPGWSSALDRLAVHLLGPAEEAVAQLDGPLFEPAEIRADSAFLELLVQADDPAVRLRAALVLAARERHSGDVRRTLARDATLADEGPRGLRVRWAFAVDAAATSVNDMDQSDEALRRVDDLFTDEERAAALSSRALNVAGRGKVAEALELAEQAVALGTDPWLQFRLGVVLMHHGRHAEAADALHRATSVESGFRRAQAIVLRCRVLRHLGVAPEAVEAELGLALPVARRARHTWLSTRVHQLSGVLAADRGDLDAARDFLDEALHQRQAQSELGSAVGTAIDRHVLDYIEGNVPTALLDPFPGPLSEVEQAWLDLARATVHAAMGHAAAAVALGPPAVEVLARHGDPSMHELVCPLAVALAPHRAEMSRQLLDNLPANPLVDLALALVAGKDVPAPTRTEDRVLVGLAGRQQRTIRVSADGKTFVGSDGQRVDLSRRRVLGRVLAALVAHPEGLDVDRMCVEVWPGERLVGQSGTRRVHVAISSLRALGLRHAIQTDVGENDGTQWRLVAQIEPA